MEVIITIAEDLLLAVKRGEETSKLALQLAELNLDRLTLALQNDTLKKAFWINIYNAYFQILRKERNIGKPQIYKSKLFTIVGQQLSLDDVEHGILRRYRYKYSLGFFANFLAPNLIKTLAVEKIDYRIHFALNCGAKSCPPIACYTVNHLETQLDMATQSFLEGESQFDEVNKIVYTTTLFKWFLKDFGGIQGIKTIFYTQLNRDIADYTIKYNTYSWEEALDNYTT